MITLTLKPAQLAFIIAVPLLVVAIIVLVLVIFITVKNRRVKYREHYYKKIYKVAFDQDYYLVNDFYFNIEDGKKACIDHILFGEKFIYIILDYYYEGNVSGKMSDKSLVYTDAKGKKFYTDNPLMYLDAIISRLCIVSGLDESLIIGVVMVNDSCDFLMESDNKDLVVLKRKEFPKFVKESEARDIAPMNPEQVNSAVQAIAKIKKERKK